MTKKDSSVEPKTFYLNEQHELAHAEKPTGGGLPKYAPIDWSTKGPKLNLSLRRVREGLGKSKDPVVNQHYFLLAEPTPHVDKETTNKKKAPEGTFSETTNFAEHHSRVFRKLGFDLIQVNDDGSAMVHTKPEQLELLINSSEILPDSGPREKAKWILIDQFGLIPDRLRVDKSWIETLNPKETADTVIELQPLLLRYEIEVLIRSVAGFLDREQGEVLRGTGTDFSGRQWFRGWLAPKTISAIARKFYSVQSLHSPLISIASMPQEVSHRRKPTALNPNTINVTSSRPCVAVLDTGIPLEHLVLQDYRRGTYTDPESYGGPSGDHGSFVASRIVFGDVECEKGEPLSLVPSCSFYDAIVSINSYEIEDKSIVPAMRTITTTTPDVRVFNISFDSRLPLASLPEVEKRERLTLLQDLDNFIFANDVIVSVSAGNSPPGVIPNMPYPGHLNESEWQLGHWSQSFNALTCGASIGSLVPSGLVNKVGWPSPFTRLGPGIAKSPKPDFNAPGGNTTTAYNYRAGLGVYGCNSQGQWEDRSGTSFAAPLLSREAAFALEALQKVCSHGTRAFSATAKAFLTLTARPLYEDAPPKDLEERALGKGMVSCRELRKPFPEKAVFIWQGILEGPDDIAQVQIPIPRIWCDLAEEPVLRIVMAWNSPVNVAVRNLWACRKVEGKLRPGTGQSAIHSKRGNSHPSYPISDRLYELKKHRTENDLWIVEISYSEICEYSSAITFTPQQKVAFAAELLDRGSKPISPQAYVQRMPIAPTMSRLSIQPSFIQSPVVIKIR